MTIAPSVGHAIAVMPGRGVTRPERFHFTRAAYFGSIVAHTVLLGLLVCMQPAKLPREAEAPLALDMIFEQSSPPADQPPSPEPGAARPDAQPAPAATAEASLPDNPDPTPIETRPAAAVPDPAPVMQTPAVPIPPSVAPAPPASQGHTPGPAKSARPALPSRPSPKTTAPAMAQPATPDQPPPALPGSSPLQAAPAAQSAASGALVAAIDPAWHRALSAWMTEHKRYPEAARRRGEAGTVGVTFIVSRDGRVQSVAVTSSSGSAILDEAVSSLLDGNHVPQFPAAMPQPQVKVLVRVAYTLDQ